MFKLFSKYSKKYTLQIILVVLITIIQVMIQFFGLNMEMKNVLDQGVLQKDLNYIYQSGGRMLLFSVLIILCIVIITYLSAVISTGFRRDICRGCYQKVINMTPQDFNSFGESTLFLRTINDTNDIQKFLYTFLRTSILLPVAILLTMLSVFFLDREIFFLELTAFLAAIVYTVLTMVSTKPQFITLRSKMDYYNLLIKEKITGARTIRAYCNQKLEENKIEKADRDIRDADIRANIPLKFMSPVTMVVTQWIIVIIYLVAAKQIQAEAIELSTILLIISYTSFFASSLSVLPALFLLLPGATVASNRINELLDYQISENSAEIPIDHIDTIKICNVSFDYCGEEKILSDISFEIQKHEKVAIIGATGSGKTTLLSIIQGFYRPTEGVVEINGKPVGEYCTDSLLKCFSYETQKNVIFQDTVLNNIQMYHDEITDEYYIPAIHNAAFDDVLEKLQDGLNTEMDCGGMNLSGGQRKRLSLARTLAKPADVYVLDDPFAGLDASTERTVLTRMLQFIENKTVIMVTQRIKSIVDFDKVVVLSNGKIVGIGKHEELLSQCVEYKEIYDTQCYLEKE